ncbi:MAG: hypothetical protein IJF54_05305 [Clostridia bacterium]|nr:hypothetical protein [Clostridia bacterium]
MAKILHKSDKIMICILAGVIVLASLIGVLVYSLQITDYTTVANVDGIKISAGELRDQMLRDRSEIIKYYQEKHNVSVEDGFWNITLEGTTPMEKLRETAMENVKKYKLKQQLAVKYGIITDTSYKAFIKALDSENAQREQKIAMGEVIYGPKEYTLDAYYDYYISNMEIKLKEKMSEKGQPLYAEEQQLKDFYDEKKDVYYLNSDTAQFKCFTLGFQGGGEKSDYTQNEAYEIMDKVLQLVKTDKNYEATIAKLYPDVKKTNLSLTKENASQASKSDPILFGETKNLAVGQTSAVFVDKYNLRVVTCLSREAGGYMSYEECADTVKSQYNTEKLEEYVLSLYEKSKAQTNWKFEKVKVQ